MIGTMALVPQMVDAVKVPVVASGGIMAGRGIAAALALGASAVQLGTAFLTCDECSIAAAYAAYKDAILMARASRILEGVRLARRQSARDLIASLLAETEAAIDRLR